MTTLRPLLCLVVLVATVVYANPPPLHIGPGRPIAGIGNAEWGLIHQAARAYALDLKQRVGRAFGLPDEPLSVEEMQCLLNRTTQEQIRALHALMLKTGDARSARILAELLEVIKPTGPGTDWCARKGPGGENRGLSIYNAGTTPPEGGATAAAARAVEALKEKAREWRDRPLTWEEAIAIVGAAMLAAPVLAPL